MSYRDHLPDDEPARSPLDEWRELTAVIRQGKRDARGEGQRAVRAAIRDLHETRLPLREALRQRIDLDRLDPLDAVAQVALDASSSACVAPWMLKTLAKATNTGAKRCASAFAVGVSGFGWPVAKPWTEPWS